MEPRNCSLAKINKIINLKRLAPIVAAKTPITPNSKLITNSNPNGIFVV